MAKHVDHSGQPYAGELKLDLTGVAPLLVDLPHGATRGLRRTRPGVDKLLAELAAAVPKYGKDAGISPDVYQEVLTKTKNIDDFAPVVVLVTKLYEVMIGTEAKLEDDREQAIAQIADAIRSKAKRTKTPSLVSPFKEFFKYVSQVAVKGLKTRASNKAKKTALAAPAAAVKYAKARLGRAMQERQSKNDRPVVSLPPKRIPAEKKADVKKAG